MSEIRTQIQIIDSKWSSCRQRTQIDVRQRPLITSDEWRKLRVAKTIEDDWGLWNEKGPTEQWHALESIGCISQRPAPGVAEEGSDEEAYKLDNYLTGGDVEIPIPVLPPRTKSAAPYDVMPQKSDPTSRESSDKTRLGQIPERPAEPKPGPPEAPKVAKAANQASENVMTSSKTNQWHMQTTSGRNVAPASGSSTGAVTPTPLDEMWTQEGGRLLGFGYLRSYSYREVRSWICDGTVSINGLVQ